MKNLNYKYCFAYHLLMVLIFLFATGFTAVAEEKIRIGILPFEIHAPSNLEYLRQTLPVRIGEQLELNGAETIQLDDHLMGNGVDIDHRALQNLGLEKGLDYLIWGSLFTAGGEISIDARLFNVLTLQEPQPFFSRAGAIENLSSAVTTFCKEVSSEIFGKKIIVRVSVKGNRRIESDAVLKVVDVKQGDIFNSSALSRDLKKVFEMGYFEDVRIESEKSEKGLDLIFSVTEKPSVRKIKYVGNYVYEDQDISDVVRTGTGSILNIYKINEDIERIKSLYTEKNYHNCEISYELNMLENNQADISFTIKEGKKLKVEQIIFKGNKFFTEEELKDVIKTDEKGFFSWLTSSGDLDKNELEQDVYRIDALYKNNGFINSRVSDPEVLFEKEHIVVKYKVQEGDQYKVGSVSFKGDLIVTEEKLLETLEMKKGDLYSREKLRTNVFAVTDIYMDKGFANADIAPGIQTDDESKIVDITFLIEKGTPVYLERILISGNSKTRDKVIRRQLKVYEQDLYSMSKIQRSVRNLQRIDYFENVDIKTSKGTRDDTLNLNVEITEKATGAFNFGGGYGSEDKLFGMISISERNFMGKGQILSAKAEVSSTATRFTLSFTEPWMFDIPLTFGVDAFNWDKDYEDKYKKDSTGGAVRLGYKIFDYTSLNVKYGYEDFTISDVHDDYTPVKAGRYITSSTTLYLIYDSRNKPFNPTEGSEHSISIEYAGGFLGGEIDFTKYIAETGWYYPLFWKLTGFLHARGGFLDDRTPDEDEIDIDYERFYLGGINSVRGYEWQDIRSSHPDNPEERGGEKFIQFNAEIIFPIVEDLNLSGVVFCDAGDVYRKNEDFTLEDLYSSYGGGFRWYSPMGPIRIEYGKILNGNEHSGGRWEFSMGGAF